MIELQQNLNTIKNLLPVFSKAEASNMYHVPISNLEFLHSFLTQKINAQAKPVQNAFKIVKYKKGEEIVHLGKIKNFNGNENFNYAFVPLGFILKGEVIIIKDDKATKKLGRADFIGLFETSDWLANERLLQIGDWTLLADSEVEILFFANCLLSQVDEASEKLRSYLIELARFDSVPQPITTLSLLDWVASHTTRSRIADCVIIAHTHLLPNNAPFFRHLSYLVDFGKVFVLEKPYSTIRSVFDGLVKSGFEIVPVRMEAGAPYEFSVQKSLEILWRKVIEEQKRSGFRKILIVDDGGDLWHSIPWQELDGIQIAGVEQTQRGIARVENSKIKIPPIVSVASSGIKKLVEAEFIGTSVVKKLQEIGVINENIKIGILGMGSIGIAVEKALNEMKMEAIFYDPNFHTTSNIPENAVGSMDSLLNESDLIIGTTGKDSLQGTALERVRGKKILASASSADVEFASLLKLAQPSTEPFGTIKIYVHDKLEIDILNGGYPINFDREKDATPDEDIVLTRCLMYIGAMQAAALLQEGNLKSELYKLDKLSQRQTLERWIAEKNKSGSPIPIICQDVQTITEFTSLKNGKEMLSVWR